jgi:uncharacterized protein YdeI (YjbR/CyaY-like superfamily)
MITNPSEFFQIGCGRCKRFATTDCSVKKWEDGLAALREICRGEGLEETAKWGHPCYMAHGRNIALIGAFQKDFTLTFMNASLISDVHGVLQKAGPNAQVPSLIRFGSVADVNEQEPILREYLRRLVGCAERGEKPAKIPSPIDLPDELVEVLDSDPELAEAFASLTPGRQRSYAIVVSGAKKSETRFARIERFRPQILSGKGANER